MSTGGNQQCNILSPVWQVRAICHSMLSWSINADVVKGMTCAVCGETLLRFKLLSVQIMSHWSALSRLKTLFAGARIKKHCSATISFWQVEQSVASVIWPARSHSAAFQHANVAYKAQRRAKLSWHILKFKLTTPLCMCLDFEGCWVVEVVRQNNNSCCISLLVCDAPTLWTRWIVDRLSTAEDCFENYFPFGWVAM